MIAPVGLDQRMEDCLILLGKVAAITEVSVVLDQQTDASLCFRTDLIVFVPGAEIQIQACGTAPELSFDRAASMLEKRLRQRGMQRAREFLVAGERPSRRRSV